MNYTFFFLYLLIYSIIIKGLTTEIKQIQQNIEVFIDFRLIETSKNNKTEANIMLKTKRLDETLTDEESVKIIEDSLDADMQSDYDDHDDDEESNDNESFLKNILDEENNILVIITLFF